VITCRSANHLGQGSRSRKLRQTNAETDSKVRAEQESASDASESNQDMSELFRHDLPLFRFYYPIFHSFLETSFAYSHFPYRRKHDTLTTRASSPERNEEVFMAQFSRHDRYSEQTNWQSKTMSEEEYHKLERLSPNCKYEYIDGRAYMMSGGSVAHDLITYNIRAALNRQLRPGSCRVFGVDVQTLLGKKTNGKPYFVYPDATVSCNAADGHRDNTLVKSPRVVVEVLSPSTEARDRGIKFKAYQRCPTIQEIVLVSQFSPHVEVWQCNEEHPENLKAWLCRHYGPDEAVELLSLNIQVAMAEIYQELVFDDAEEENED